MSNDSLSDLIDELRESEQVLMETIDCLLHAIQMVNQSQEAVLLVTPGLSHKMEPKRVVLRVLNKIAEEMLRVF